MQISIVNLDHTNLNIGSKTIISNDTEKGRAFYQSLVTNHQLLITIYWSLVTSFDNCEKKFIEMSKPQPINKENKDYKQVCRNLGVWWGKQSPLHPHIFARFNLLKIVTNSEKEIIRNYKLIELFKIVLLFVR